MPIVQGPITTAGLDVTGAGQGVTKVPGTCSPLPHRLMGHNFVYNHRYVLVLDRASLGDHKFLIDLPRSCCIIKQKAMVMRRNIFDLIGTY